MGRSKTRRKNQRGGQASDDQDPDVSETEPSSSDNISESLNDTVVLSNNSNNVMDTDVEDSEQNTKDSFSSTDESEAGEGKGVEEELIKPEISVSSSTGEDMVGGSKSSRVVDQWLDNQGPSQVSQEVCLALQPSPSCQHVKGSISMPGIRKALKTEVNVGCSARPCKSSFVVGAEGDGEGDVVSSSSNKEVWFCLQCGHFGCGDHKALGGDAEGHYKTPRSDQHNIVLKIGGEMDKLWCYNCESYIDAKNSYFKDPLQFLKRHPKFRMSLSNNKTGSAPAIALGPPPPPPQPEVTVENNQFKSVFSKNKMNNRNKPGLYSSSWDNTSRDDWPLGLENLGNTCFMNSALQCLSRTRSLSPKLDLYGTGNTLEILVTADPPYVEVLGTVSPDINGENGTSILHMGRETAENFMDENGDSNHVVPATESETGGSSPSSSEMDSLLDVASGTSSKSSPSKELTPENYKAEIEQELKKCLRLKLVIPKDSMTARLRHAFKAMTRSADVQQGNGGSYGTSDYFGHRGRHVFTPSAIHSSLAKHFRPGQQHDSHELLRTVVDMMKKDQIKAFRLAIMQCYGIKKSEGKNCDPKIAELLKMWDRKLYHKTFVDEIFGGELVTFQTCMTCNSVRKSHEDFLDLSLPIRVYTKTNHIPKRTYSIFDDDGDSNRSLEDCLNSFIEPEQLTGSNAVECENCHRRNLEKLAAGASFEEVFPGVKPPSSSSESRKIKSCTVEPEPSLETEMDALEPLGMEDEPQQAYSNATEDMDDLDEPAVDGILGNTSDMEDEGNDVPPVYLGPDNEEKATTDFINSPELPNKDNISLSLAATQDEGFSESDSSEEKKSASISASSSRNSISEADNVVASSSSKQKGKEVSKPIPITKCPCSRRQMVWRPPECLTIHLKRFQITSHGTSKLGDRITFPYILNLTPFCAPQGDEVEDRDVFDEDGEVKYALYGIVEHSGSLHWGHYVAYIKVHGSSPLSVASEESCSSGTSSMSNNSTESTPTPDKWFYISDSSVSPSSLESVLGMDPYILFYERIRGQDKRDKLAQLQRLNNPCSSSSTSSNSSSTSTIVATPSTSLIAGTSSFDFDKSFTADSTANYSLD